MSQESQYSRPGEKSNPNPFGRGCLPLTIVLLLTLGLAGWIGWTFGDWWGAGIGVVALGLGWMRLIWS